MSEEAVVTIPTGAPGEATAAEETPSSESEPNEFETLAEELAAQETEDVSEGEERGEETPPAPEPEQAEQPREPEPEPSEKPEPEPAQEVAEEPEEQKEQVQEQPEPEEPQGPTEEELLAQRQQALEQLAERYQLSEEEAEALFSEPNKVLPRFAATLFLDVYDQVVNALQMKLPDIVSGVIAQQEAQRTERESFFAEWPELNKPEYEPVIQRIKEAYWQMNPNASREQAVKEIGAQAWVALRLPLDGLLKRSGAADEAVQSQEQQQQQAPRTPANTGGPAYTPPKQVVKNEWEALAEELIADDSL